MFKSKPKGAQEVVKNLKESLSAFDKKDIKEKDLKKVRADARSARSLLTVIALGAGKHRQGHRADEVYTLWRR